jgi:hypothetical protein
VAVRVLSGENVLTSGQGIKVPVIGKKALGQVTVAVAGASGIGEEEILRQSVELIPAKGLVRVGPGILFRA